MENKKIEVQTPLGVLCAEVGGDPSAYPEIFLYIRTPSGAEIDLTCASLAMEAPDHIDVFNYRDTKTDIWSDKFVISKEDLTVAEDLLFVEE